MNEYVEDPRAGLSLCTPVNHSTSNMYTHTQPGLGNNNNISSNPAASFYLNRARGNSTSSLASSVASDSYNYSYAATAASGYTDDLSPAFSELIMRVYQELCSDPTVTPFDTLQPPAGILDRTAKLTVQRTMQEGTDTGLGPQQATPALLQALVRHRLGQELRREGYLSRNGSAASLSGSGATGTATATGAPLPPQFSELLHNDPLDSTWFRAAVPLSSTGLSSTGLSTTGLSPDLTGPRLLQPQPHPGRVVSPGPTLLPLALPQLQAGFGQAGFGQPCGRETQASPQFGQGLTQGFAQQRGLPMGMGVGLGYPLGMGMGLGRTASPLATTQALTAANVSRHEQSMAMEGGAAGAAGTAGTAGTRRTRDVLSYRRGL